MILRATRLLVPLLAICSGILAAESTNPADNFARDVGPVLRMYCVECHSAEDPEAGLSLEFTQAPDLAEQFDEWTVLLQKVSGKEMPPEDAMQPSDVERGRLVSWVAARLGELDCTKQTPQARTTIRRLNRFEYNNVIRDLLGVDVTPADDFPADNVGEGFDNIGEVLSLPPLLMEKYLEAAESVTDVLLGNHDAWQRLFGNAESKEEVRTPVSHLAERAFRRPLRDEERDRLMELYEHARASGETPEHSLAFVTQAILISPQFLFRFEEMPGQTTSTGDRQLLGDFQIASRLSFFLWSTLPDDELFDLARAKRLNSADVLTEQVRRMLADPKSEALVKSFAGQWLELRLLESVAPDPDLFPSFDEELRTAMIEETSQFFRNLVVRDGNILELIDSDYTFLNERLAAHYGLEGVQGGNFRRVSLQDDRRGGILSQASILTLTSNPTRTSPVKRGKWILENILGTPPPPPPPNVPELEAGEELLGSLREKMQQHRENPSCAVCHRKMDALGFGFENFDAIGKWRTRDGRYEIDASGELPGGNTFTTPAELRSILKSNSREFTSCLCRKLLTYALGRQLDSEDRCLVDEIVAYVEAHEHRFSALVTAIVTSDAFRFAGTFQETTDGK